MKKKLLITLGCSFTEGVGCYEPSLLDEKGNPLFDHLTVYDASLDRFHRYGWPARLQEKLKYDCLWNLGAGGASNSSSVKQWFDVMSNESLSKQYDVLVVWMVTFAARISFYKGGRVFPLIPNGINGRQGQALYENYIDFLGDDFKKDTLLETLFYVKIIKNICSLAGYNFLYLNVDNEEGKELDLMLKSPAKSLNPMLQGTGPIESTYDFAYCGHPTESSYELIAEKIFQAISKKHEFLINSHTPETFEMKYLGTPNQW